MEAFERLIDLLHMEDLRNGTHPSVFDENEGYDMLIMRLPAPGAVLEFRSVGFILTAEGGYRFDAASSIFKRVGDRFEGPHGVIDRMIDAVLGVMTKYGERIADVEEELYLDRISKGFMTEWLGLKRDILRIERVMMRASETMAEVIDYYAETAGFPLNHYSDLHEHIERIVRSATLQLSKLDYLYNFHSARTNEKMNRMIYLLTIISAVFLPLNLLVGFFGMNTGGLPFAESGSGTFYAVILMGGFAAVTALLFLLGRMRMER